MVVGTKLIINNSLNLLVLLAVVVMTYFLSLQVRQHTVLTKEESIVFLEMAMDAQLNVAQTQQFLQDISATRAEGGYDDGFAKAEEQAQAFHRTMEAFRPMFRKENDQTHLQVIDDLESTFGRFYELGKTLAQAYIANGPEGGNRLMPAFDEVAEQMHHKLEVLVQGQKNEVNTSMTEMEEAMDFCLTFLLFAGVFGALFSLGYGTYLYRSIVTLLKTLVANLSSSSDQVTSAAEEISRSAIQLSQGATEQAASLEETSSAMEQLAGQTQNNANNATESAKNMQQILQMVQKSVEITKSASRLSDQAKTTSQQGVQSMTEISDAMKLIGKGSEKIVDIIEVINEITHQTKMLSTNAAIEAARAGEQGKGFAVVADEVSKLAENSKKAAKEIEGLIKESVRSAKEGQSKAAQGEQVLQAIFAQATQVAELMDNTLEASNLQASRIEEISGQIDSIQHSSTEQASGVHQVSRAIVEIETVTQSNAASSEEAASASEELNAQAKMMKSLVEEIAQYVGIKVAHQAVAAPRPEAFVRASSKPLAKKPANTEVPKLEARPRHVKANKAIPMRDDFSEF